MPFQVSPGGYYFTSTADTGRASLNINTGYSSWDTSRSQAECHAIPGLLDGTVYAWAECGTEVIPETDGTLDVEVEGEYATEINSFGVSSRTRFEIIIHNITDDVPVTNTMIYDETLTWERKFDTDSYMNSMIADLESGKHYLVGVRADTWGEGAATFASYADAAPDGTYSGYHKYKQMEMNFS